MADGTLSKEVGEIVQDSKVAEAFKGVKAAEVPEGGDVEKLGHELRTDNLIGSVTTSKEPIKPTYAVYKMEITKPKVNSPAPDAGK